MKSRSLGKVIERGLSNGNVVLIEDVPEFLDPVVELVLVNRANRAAQSEDDEQKLPEIRMGDRDITIDDNFDFYLMTKISNPQFLPEIFIKATVINFTVTQTALEEQLLGELAKKELPEMEQKKTRLVRRLAQDQKDLAKLEEDILQFLQSTREKEN